ncbi:hypothetical protein E2C01_102078 [Portunus trituberculatus]|uniref:Uncharacterized protein n=1 Tax=Portunus trituberculatus TaxID=210409 RepID=A0A5B7KHE7_PORTR|nr:hypothetical protein [Portunus trituberculatus]
MSGSGGIISPRRIPRRSCCYTHTSHNKPSINNHFHR